MPHRIVSCLRVPAPVRRSSTRSARSAGFCYVTCSPVSSLGLGDSFLPDSLPTFPPQRSEQSLFRAWSFPY
ncbi:hypothetical protein E2C01_036090 [Portunus trituberculatus]|uniref:Uncharacterized protein n=1 Tax=Portunus trituberculatus TaxID=210409 RepID=A0A5B7FBI4_PORTR|nr:hypothetical protein [Portunus trituberculatus]